MFVWAYLTFLTVHATQPNIRPSAYLDCADSAEWTEFRLKLSESKINNYTFDEPLYNQALGLFEKYYTSVDFMDSLFLHEQICRPEIPILSEAQIRGPSHEAVSTSNDRFCFVGFVSATFYIAIHRLSFDAASANELLQLGAVLLGKELALDYFRSTSWPIAGLDLFLNLNSTVFTTADEIFAWPPIPPLAMEAFYAFPVSRAIPFRQSRRRSDTTGPRFAVIGTHGTLSREPVDWLYRLHGRSFDVRYYGLEARWCTLMQFLCGNHWRPELSDLLEKVEKNGKFTWDSLKEEVTKIVAQDDFLVNAEVLVCTEPLTVCLIILEVLADQFAKNPYMIGYFGVALLNLLPYGETASFWKLFDRFVTSSDRFVAASNAPMVSEQFFYQSGVRFPSIRPFSFYTETTHWPRNAKRAFVWKSSIASFGTFQCVVDETRFANPLFSWSIDFMEKRTTYDEAAGYDAIILLPWDTAIMTFYEFYSLGIPIFMPSEKFSIYQFTHTRGQLTVGEPHYRSIRPGHTPYAVQYVQEDVLPERTRNHGVQGLRVAQQLLEDILDKVMKSENADVSRNLVHSALELAKDMKYLISVVDENSGDTYSSAGEIRKANAGDLSWMRGRQDDVNYSHPFSPFQMTPPGSSDYVRKLAGVWWLRNDIRFEAMRYWNQFSDYEIFPGVIKFDNVLDLFEKMQNVDLATVKSVMEKYNLRSEEDVRSFWSEAYDRAFRYIDSQG